MSVINKVFWTLGLIIVFLSILFSGRTNIRNFEEVQSSIEEIYRDRLVVKGLIFELSSLLHQKEVATLTEDQTFYASKNGSINAEIKEHLVAFHATRLTTYEEETLYRFSKSVEELQLKEKAYGLSDRFNLSKAQSYMLIIQLKGLQKDLKILSSIQLSEGKDKVSSSDKAVSSMNSLARVENFLLLILAVLMLVIIFVVPKPKDHHPERKNIEVDEDS